MLLISLIPPLTFTTYYTITLTISVIHWFFTGRLINLNWIKKYLPQSPKYAARNPLQDDVDKKIIPNNLLKIITDAPLMLETDGSHKCRKCNEAFVATSKVTIRGTTYYHTGCTPTQPNYNCCDDINCRCCDSDDY
ncbi:MAG: hypothetical protein Harvfovirus17_25 [Harvfovirus sp.]|uniref:Uncharacterized protein n=1 Tax=Harvfovirus sp. TaxID=2487768 RepID=A0A3G5A4J2_9VIRU|nr:MAG: hypothetical protein Harvfovirus17_25 [Harvfovirus sp.]